MNHTFISNINRLKSGARLKDYVAVIVRRRLVIIISLAAVFLSTLYYTSKSEDIYESYSIIVIEESQYSLDLLMKLSRRSMSFYQGILNSRTFVEMVLDSIGRERVNEVFPKFSREDAHNYISGNISLRPTSYTSFLRFNVRARTGELAYAIAAAGTELFRKRCEEVESEESRRALQEIEKQLTLVRGKLENAELEYRTFVDKSGNVIEGTTLELSALRETYASNLATLGIKEADLAAEKKQLESLEKKITPATQQRSSEYLQLRARLQDLEKEKAKLEGLGIRLSGFSTIDREIEELESKLLQDKRQESPRQVDTRLVRQWQELRKSVVNKESELDLFKRRLEMYYKAIENYKKDNPDLLSKSLELLRLKRSKEIFENVYKILLEKAEEERIRSASSSAGIKTVDKPRIPDKPIPKNEKRFYILGIILGLGLGLAIAFFIEFNDTTVKSNEDVERYIGLPVLGTIPHIVVHRKEEIEIRRRSSKSKQKTSVTQYPSNLLSFKGDDSVITEAYRSLRTNLSFVSPDKPIQTLLLTSAGPGEGKSLTISNLGMAYAQMGKKTLLVDTDLRRPVLHHLFKMKREPGFTEMFMDESALDNAIRPTGFENLSIITAGMFTPNPAELIGSQKMGHHIELLKERFDNIFFDTPPIVAVTDATLLGTRLDGVLLIVKSHHTDRDVLLRALSMLNNVGVHVFGTVLNDIDLSHRYSSYGYYKYYYHYYKTKKD